MKRNILKNIAVLAILCLSINVFGQDYEALLNENPFRAGGIYHSYEIPTSSERQDTKAPKGYKPFYISHYGRHGSRYHTSDKYFRMPLEKLQEAHKLNALTEKGEELYHELKTLVEMHEGMYGQLTQKGGREHQGISKRMLKKFPRVFNQKDRRDIYSVSSTIQRCIISMCYFTNELKGNKPKLNFHFDTGERYMNYIIHESHTKDMRKEIGASYDSLMLKYFDPSHFINDIFKDKTSSQKILQGKENEFSRGVFFSGCICEDMDNQKTNLLKYFTKDEIYTLWWGYNIKMYGAHCNSQRYGYRAGESAKYLLKNITDCADNAIKGNSTAANFRFGHDTGLLPLINLIRLEPESHLVPFADADKVWIGFKRIPMGSNIQFIFYKNHKNNILTKIVYNEKEVTIAGLDTYNGVYYNWNNLRDYFKTLYKSIEE